MLHGTPRAEPGLDEDDRNETSRGDEVVELGSDSEAQSSDDESSEVDSDVVHMSDKDLLLRELSLEDALGNRVVYALAGRPVGTLRVYYTLLYPARGTAPLRFS